jgi:hypothetical protein
MQTVPELLRKLSKGDLKIGVVVAYLYRFSNQISLMPVQVNNRTQNFHCSCRHWSFGQAASGFSLIFAILITFEEHSSGFVHSQVSPRRHSFCELCGSNFKQYVRQMHSIYSYRVAAIGRKYDSSSLLDSPYFTI